MINLYIDTNVYLSFFHLTNEDLEELRKLLVLVQKREVQLFLPKQTLDEFKRNRDAKIADALKGLKLQKFKMQFPQICKDYEEYSVIRDLLQQMDVAREKLLSQIDEDVSSRSLRADEVIKELFDAATIIELTDGILSSARKRIELGNPPGKNHSLGDAVNWESLLDAVPNNRHIHFVSDDKDFRSELAADDFNSFLIDEWQDRKQSKLKYYPRLSAFFISKYPHIKLATELERDLLVRRLEVSVAYDTTHSVIALFEHHESFSISQADAILQAVVTNGQIGRILGDEDVKIFIERVIKGKESDLNRENVEKLGIMFEELRLQDETKLEPAW